MRAGHGNTSERQQQSKQASSGRASRETSRVQQVFPRGLVCLRGKTLDVRRLAQGSSAATANSIREAEQRSSNTRSLLRLGRSPNKCWLSPSTARACAPPARKEWHPITRSPHGEDVGIPSFCNCAAVSATAQALGASPPPARGKNGRTDGSMWVQFLLTNSLWRTAAPYGQYGHDDDSPHTHSHALVSVAAPGSMLDAGRRIRTSRISVTMVTRQARTNDASISRKRKKEARIARLKKPYGAPDTRGEHQHRQPERTG